jgi:hypothetical protein
MFHLSVVLHLTALSVGGDSSHTLPLLLGNSLLVRANLYQQHREVISFLSANTPSRSLHLLEWGRHPAIAASSAGAVCFAAAAVAAFAAVGEYSAYMLPEPELELVWQINVELGPALPSDD